MSFSFSHVCDVISVKTVLNNLSVILILIEPSVPDKKWVSGH